jgi:hypothetical protein
MTKNTTPACDLCGLPVEIPDFSLSTTDGPKHFCCEGCQGIYRLLHEAAILPDADVDVSLSRAGEQG